ncbi:MAG: PfkB family carbohydrate kinase [Solirubrobacteraceae bacterium]
MTPASIITTASRGHERRSPTLCVGDALVDLICEHPIEGDAPGDVFVPRPGGAVANVAVIAARAGAHVALAGGAGEDAWGHWLRRRLDAEGLELSRFELISGAQTPIAMVTVDAHGEPRYRVYGDPLETVVEALGERVDDAVSDCAALFLSSNTLVRSQEREVTMRARELALELGRPVIFDPNLRLHRWSSHSDAAASADACVPGALLVRCNRVEAELMTGEEDPERAAQAMLKAGARMVVVTLGAGGAILRGEMRADAPGAKVPVVSTSGAGDVLSGILLAALAKTDFYPPAVAASLAEAVAQSARACERWAAID